MGEPFGADGDDITVRDGGVEKWTGQIHRGDAAETMARVPESSVHCVVTSPPFWQLRDYGVEGQIGLEDTLAEYVAALDSADSMAFHKQARYEAYREDSPHRWQRVAYHYLRFKRRIEGRADEVAANGDIQQPLEAWSA